MSPPRIFSLFIVLSLESTARSQSIDVMLELYCGIIMICPFLGGGFRYCFSFTEMIQLDEHIFQMGGSTTNQELQ